MDHRGEVLSVSFSGDGKYLASGSGYKAVSIWEVETSQCLETFQYLNTSGEYGAMVSSVSFSYDEKFVASTDSSEVKILELTSKRATILKGHLEVVSCVSFSSDGKYLASSSLDRTVRIWVKINGGWICDKIFNAFESPLSARHAKLDQVRASKRNKILLKQLVEKGEIKENEFVEEEEKNDSKDEETDETEGEMSHNPTLARDAANEFSELFRKKNKARYEELPKQKFVQLILIQVLANSDSIQKGLLKPDFILY
mgnify:CR=1 FL=1